MKKLLLLLAPLFFSVSSFAEAPFNEGEHYQVLDIPAASTPKVTEFFSFYCPYCYRFYSVSLELQKALPEGVKIQKQHISFMGGNMATPVSKAFAAMISLDIEDKMTPVLFNQIHNIQKPPSTEEALRQLFLDNGVTEKQYDSAYGSFAVDSMVRRFDKQFQDSGLTGVPALIVNDRYWVQSQSVSGNKEYIELVNYLLTL